MIGKAENQVVNNQYRLFFTLFNIEHFFVSGVLQRLS